MLKLGIIGSPLSHSLSPVMHLSALKELGISGSYELLETPPDCLLERVKELKTSGFTGFNITIPLKVFITPLLVSVDDAANLVGAVNTVYIDERRDLHGYNTDVYGFVEAIPSALKQSLKNKKATVIGAGGAARAVVTGLAGLGVELIEVYARDEKKALRIKDVLTDNFKNIKVKILSFNENCDLSQSSIVVNTTPIGMHGEFEGQSPLSSMSIDSMPNDAIVYDLIYRPRETKLLKQAKKRGLVAIDGSEMLVLQGAKALTIWTGKKAPIEVMRQTLLKNL